MDLSAVYGVPVVVAVVAVIRQSWKSVPVALLPGLAVVAGIALAFLAAAASIPPLVGETGPRILATGLLVGLTAAGVYDAAVKPVVAAIKGQ